MLTLCPMRQIYWTLYVLAEKGCVCPQAAMAHKSLSEEHRDGAHFHLFPAEGRAEHMVLDASCNMRERKTERNTIVFTFPFICTLCIIHRLIKTNCTQRSKTIINHVVGMHWIKAKCRTEFFYAAEGSDSFSWITWRCMCNHQGDHEENLYRKVTSLF